MYQIKPPYQWQVRQTDPRSNFCDKRYRIYQRYLFSIHYIMQNIVIHPFLKMIYICFSLRNRIYTMNCRYTNMYGLLDFCWLVFKVICIVISEIAVKTQERCSRLKHTYMQYASIIDVFIISPHRVRAWYIICPNIYDREMIDVMTA